MKLLISLIAFVAGALCTSLHAQDNDTFRLGMIAMPPAQGNPFFTTGTTPHMFYTAIFDTLTMVNEKGEVVPQLATSWEQTDDLTWTMDIRTGVQFSNGEPINAETVVAMVEAFEREDFRTFRVPDEFYFIAGARALDDDTVEMTTSSPQALLPRYMSFFYLVPPRHLEEHGAEILASNPIGSGPFVVENWLAERILFRANETSWRPPRVERLETLVLPQATTRLQALISERIDVAINLGPDDEALLTANGLRLQPRNPVRISVVALNTETVGTPFKDVRVRRAMNYAVDRAAIAETLLGGYVTPASQPTPENAIGYDPSLEPYPYDPDKARALLAEAGYADGFFTVFETVAGSSSATDAVMQQVAADLALVGVDVELRPILYSQQVARMTQGGWDGHMFSVDFATGPTMDGLRPVRLHSCSWNTPWYCDPVSEALYQRARAAPDLETRIELSQQVIKRYRDEATTILLFPLLGMDGIGPRVKNWAPANDRPMYHLAELKEE